MKATRKYTLAGAVAGAAGAMAISAALALQPAWAQSASPTPTAATTAPTTNRALAKNGDRATAANEFLDRLAAKLGITSDRLRSAASETEKELIQARARDGKLTQQQADQLIELIDKNGPVLRVQHLAPSSASGRDAGGAVAVQVGARVAADAVAKATGLTADQVHEQLRAGKTLAEIGVAAGKSRADLTAAITNATRQGLDEAVQSGRLTREQADQLLNRATQQIDRALDQRTPARPAQPARPGRSAQPGNSR